MTSPAEPAKTCPLCPRLVAYRAENARLEPTWFNGPAPSFGDPAATLLIVGLAPGRMGANRTGRPFTGDFAGELLYGTLLKLGLAEGVYRADPADGLALKGCMITNAVRCAPPENKPTPAEIAACRPFLRARIEALPHLRAILALGAIAHASVLSSFDVKLSAAPFAHGAQITLPGKLSLISSYHCSRYNTQTRKLTPDMFETVMELARSAAAL